MQIAIFRGGEEIVMELSLDGSITVEQWLETRGDDELD
jgi:hypothetical protein